MKKENLQSELVHILQHESKWVKVHAAEFLLWEGLNRDLVYDIYKKIEEPIYESEPPYRIGVWRVLYQSALSDTEREEYAQKIVKAFDQKVDTLHIIETLAKLKIPFTDYNGEFKKAILDSDKIDPYFLYGVWNLYADATVDKNELFERLYNVLVDSSAEDNLKVVVSYVFRYVPLEDQQWNKLTQSIPLVSSVSVQKYLLISLLQRSKSVDTRYKAWRAQLVDLCKEMGDHALIMSALSNHKDDYNASQLITSYTLLSDTSNENYNADLHATAAYSMLKYLNH